MTRKDHCNVGNNGHVTHVLTEEWSHFQGSNSVSFNFASLLRERRRKPFVSLRVNHACFRIQRNKQEVTKVVFFEKWRKHLEVEP